MSIERVTDESRVRGARTREKEAIPRRQRLGRRPS